MDPEARSSQAPGTTLDAARSELERERARYVSLFELAPVPNVVTDGAGLIREANLAATELLGVQRRFLLGKPLALFAVDRADFRRRIVGLGRDSGSAWETLLQPRRGRPLHVHVVARRIGDAVLPDEILWAVADIERRASAEIEMRLLAAELEGRVEQRTGELEREQALLAGVVQHVPVPLVVLEAPSGRTLLANDAADRILDELGPSEIDRWRDLAPIAAALTGEIRTGEPVEITGAQGGRITLEVNAAPIRDRSGTVAIVGAVLQDVTARERRERAEREFVTNAAHELLTPLAAITSAVEVLQGGAKEDPEQRDRFLAHAERETARLGRLARALLVLARAQMGAEAPKGEVIALAPLLDEIVDVLSTAPGVVVTVECPPELALVTNRELAAQALVNIATNAAKFTHAGSILVRARPEGDALVAVEVSDSGSGIGASEEALVFDRFYRSAESPTREGFGLGLAIARQAVDALGGEIDLHSRAGEGTTVVVTLPGARLTSS